MHFKQLLTQPLLRVPNKLVIFALIIAILGFADATYLTIEHFQGKVPPCTITSGCEQVLTSSYSTVAGIPVSLGGAIFYLIMCIGLFTYLEAKKVTALKWVLLLTTPAFMASLTFVYLQVFVIHSYCAYCLGSALSSTILFIVAMDIFGRYQQHTA